MSRIGRQPIVLPAGVTVTVGEENVVTVKGKLGELSEKIRPSISVKVEGNEATYSIDYTPARAGMFDVALRVYPKNDRLPHRMDFALVKWA